MKGQLHLLPGIDRVTLTDQNGEVVSNIGDLFIALALRRKRFYPRGYGGIGSGEVSKLLACFGIKLTAGYIRDRQRKVPKLFGDGLLTIENPDIQRQVDFLARTLRSLSHPKAPPPPPVYRREKFKEVITWSTNEVEIRVAEEEDLKKDEQYRDAVAEGRLMPPAEEKG